MKDLKFPANVSKLYADNEDAVIQISSLVKTFDLGEEEHKKVLKCLKTHPFRFQLSTVERKKNSVI